MAWVVDLDGRPVATEQRPSAETVLHTRLYRRDAGIGCVLHTHSLVQTVASRVFAPSGGVRRMTSQIWVQILEPIRT